MKSKAPSKASTKRPLGVVILVILEGVRGIIYILARSMWAIMSIIIAFGMWTGERWTRLATMLFSILSMIVDFLYLMFPEYLLELYGLAPRAYGLAPMIDITINSVILYYLARPEVKRFFS